MGGSHSAAGDASTAADGRRVRGDRARAQILERSAAIASTDGLEGLTIGRVAAGAGVGKGNIQVLFGGKEALQLATLEWAAGLFRATVVEPALREADPVARLLALVEGWFAFVERRTLPGGCLINAVSSEYRARPGRIRDRIDGHRAETRARFRDAVVDAKNRGRIRPDVDEAQLAFELAAYQAAANVAALMDDGETFERARRTSRDRILAAAAPAPGIER